jgi:glutaredoxin
MATTLFTKTNCKECSALDSKALAKICSYETVKCDIEDEHNMARAIATNVSSFPTLITEDGKHHVGAKEILIWMKKNASC